MNFAILAAVSSKPQAAPEKASIPEQLTRAREVARQRGWQETAGPFAIPGQSRSLNVNLSDAEDAIVDQDGAHPLRDMLNAAQRGEFDVLIIYDYNRLRDLVDLVAKTLNNYGVQLFSVNQPVEPLPPEEFNTHAADSESMMRGMSQIISRSQISDFARKSRFGKLNRVLVKGLPTFRAPFGYRKPLGHEHDKDAVPVIDPVHAAVVLQVKDLYLSGFSMEQIAEHMNLAGIPTPAGKKRWTNVITRHIMTNPFYSGKVFFGGERRVLDPRTGKVKVIANLPGRIVVGQGRHEPLWDAETQQRIDDEFKRRATNYTGKRTHRLSNLLYCKICDSRVYCHYNGDARDRSRRWGCSVSHEHVDVWDRELLPLVADLLAENLRHIDGIRLPVETDRRPLLDSSLADLKSRRERLTEAYLAGVMSLLEYSSRASDLEARLKAIEAERANSQLSADRTRQRLDRLSQLAAVIDSVPGYLLHADPLQVNNELRALLDRIVISPSDIELVFR